MDRQGGADLYTNHPDCVVWRGLRVVWHLHYHLRLCKMGESNASVAIYSEPADVEAGILALQESGSELQNVSVVGSAAPPGGEPVAYYQLPGRIGCWGKMGLFWTGVWSLLFGWALISLPEVGPILVGGPLAMWIVAALDNAPLFTGFSAVGAGLYSIGIPRSRTMRYEAALKRHMYLVVVHGTNADVSRAMAVLEARRRNPKVRQSGQS